MPSFKTPPPQWLVELAERKLGKGAVVRESYGEWIAERLSALGRTKVTGGSLAILSWFLEQMSDAPKTS